jgi:hypothetical protein
MTLQEKLDEQKRNFENSAPQEALDIMHRATEDLRCSGIMDRVLKAGDPAPDFALNDENGNAVGSADLLPQGPLVISFYRGVW